MATFFEVQKTALSRMNKVNELVKKLGYHTAAEKIAGYMQAMRDKKLVVLVAGEVKRGKSSLLNAFLNEIDPVCPMNQDVCTNTVTILQYSKTERIEVVFADEEAPNGMRTEIVSRSQIAEYASEANNAGNHKNVLQINAWLPNALLKDGVVFIDTPGVGSMNTMHSEITYSFLPQADLLLFVTDAITPLSATEVAFLKRGYAQCSSVVFPLTKKDLNAEYETILQSNCRKIGDALEIPVDQVKMIPVSSLAKLNYLKNPDRERLLRNSNFAQLEEAVWTAIAERQAEVRIQPYLVATATELRVVLDSLKVQMEAIEHPEAAEDLNEKLEKYQKELETLLADGADWQIELNQFFSTKQTEYSPRENRVKAETVTLLNNKRAELGTNICREDERQQLLVEINNILLPGLNEIWQEFDRDVAELVLRLHESMALDLPITSQTSSSATPGKRDVLDINFPKKKLLDSLKNQGREMNSNRFGLVTACETLGVMIGGALGGFGGTSVGIPIEGAVGGAWLGKKLGQTLGTAIAGVGNIFSWGKKMIRKENYDTADIALVMNTFQNYINDVYNQKISDFHIVMKTVQTELSSGFKKLLNYRVQEIKKNIEDVKALLKTIRTQIPARKKELEEKIALVSEQINKLSKLQENIRKLNLEAEPADTNAMVETTSALKKEKKTDKNVYGFL